MNNIWENLKNYKNILILGFGREGKSTYSFIRENNKDIIINIGDIKDEIKNDPIFQNDKNLKFITGKNYLENLAIYDCIIKTPGISLLDKQIKELEGKLTSQSDLFVKNYRKQTIGVTGTKGKSTAASFVYHFLQVSNCDSVLVGNIGISPFDLINSIKENTIIVFEFSSHMLQTISISPHYSILLNIFPEHLDYYKTFENYTLSKANIFKFQNENDFLAIGKNEEVKNLVSKFGSKATLVNPTNFSSYEENKFIPSKQIMQNLILGAEVALLAGAKKEAFEKALETFKTLPHRLEVIGKWKGVTFVDDSISTIPEATLLALEAFKETDILIIGGMDRGISYENFVKELSKKNNLKIFCIDETGKKIYDLIIKQNPENKNYYLFNNLEDIIKKSYEILPSGGTMLLSPAAASYNQFKNFEERGEAFKNLAQKYGAE